MLASINRIETAFGTNLNVSTAGALGWMQFIPSTWEAYGVDANDDGRKDPYNPVDAICAAARYLNAAGGEEDLRTAIFAYNHADWYVDEVLLYAAQYGKLPDDLVGSLTGLTEGARFPVAADARYADDISEREAAKRSAPRKGVAGNAADVVSASPTRRGINIYSKEGAPVVAVNDGVDQARSASRKKLGKYIVLQDAYGNRFTYAELGEVSEVYPVPKEQKLTAEDFELVTPGDDDEPAEPGQPAPRRRRRRSRQASDDAERSEPATAPTQAERRPAQHRGHARAPLRLPGAPDEPRPRRPHRPARRAARQTASPATRASRPTSAACSSSTARRWSCEPLREGSQVVARHRPRPRRRPTASSPRTSTSRSSPPAAARRRSTRSRSSTAGSCSRRPRSTAPPARTRSTAPAPRVGQILLISKAQLERRVLADPRLEIYACGRQDIQTGQIDRRVLAMLEYLAAARLPAHDHLAQVRPQRLHRPPATSATTRPATPSTSPQINGLPILGNQGPGSITEVVIQRPARAPGHDGCPTR